LQKICEKPNSGLIPAGVWWMPIDRPAVDTNPARGASVAATSIMSVALPLPDEGVMLIHGGPSNDQAHAGEVVNETDLRPPGRSKFRCVGFAPKEQKSSWYRLTDEPSTRISPWRADVADPTSTAMVTLPVPLPMPAVFANVPEPPTCLSAHIHTGTPTLH
jgi:hypothetical protein